MATIFETYTESHSRPSDTPWTPEENARYAANRADAIRRANERLAAKPIKTFYLANADRIVTFWVDASKGEVEIASRYRLGIRKPVDPEVMTIEEGRRRWLELVNAGFSKW